MNNNEPVSEKGIRECTKETAENWLNQEDNSITEAQELKKAFDKNIRQNEEASENHDEYLTEGVSDVTIGLFWYFNNEIQAEYKQYTTISECLARAKEDEVYISPLHSYHIKEWYDLDRQYRKSIKRKTIEKYGEMEYDYYPRGRVLYYVNKKLQKHNYLVILDPCILNDKVVRDKIIRAFDIDGKVDFATDEHYSCNDCREQEI